MTTLQQAVEQFTQSTEELLQAVNVRKLALDAAETTTTAQAGIATAQAGIATAKAALLGSTATVTATGTVTLTSASAVYQLVNPNGAARDVTLPTLTAGDAGRAFVIKNTGSTGNFLTIKTSSGTQVGPALGNGYTLFVVWSGSVWEAL